MKQTYLLLCSLTLVLPLRTAFAENDDLAEGRLSLHEVTRAVAARNPSVKAAEFRWQAVKARVPQAAVWEDLRLRGESVVARLVNINPNGFTDQTVGLEQELPLTGKNRSLARAATAEAGAAFEDLRRTQLDVIGRARAAYYRLAKERTIGAQTELNVLMNRPGKFKPPERRASIA